MLSFVRLSVVTLWLGLFVLMPLLKPIELVAAKNKERIDSVLTQSLALYDSTRQRRIPVELYAPAHPPKNGRLQLVIFNHGYGNRDGMSYKKSTFITSFLAARGYIVASIQHELPGDAEIANSGVLRETRLPNWEQGVASIKFVIQELQRVQPSLDYQHITIIGTSNGGDMTMLFAEKYPQQLARVISLDNRRMPIPRVKSPRIYTLRSADQPADEGVLPTEAEAKKFGITIVKLAATKHNDMTDGGPAEQLAEIQRWILKFMKK